MQNVSARMVLVHRDGSSWRPALVKDRVTGRRAFRAAPPHAGSNRKENAVLIDVGEENRLHDLVLTQGYLVRCRGSAGGFNMFGVGGTNRRAIQSIILDGQVAWSVAH